jgi:heat shock protein HslJ
MKAIHALITVLTGGVFLAAATSAEPTRAASPPAGPVVTTQYGGRGEMRTARLSTGLILALVGMYLQAQTSEQKISLTGKLVRVMAIGGESTGWSIELESPTTIDGKQVNSIQVRYAKTAKLERLANKQVRASGKLAHLHDVESGDQPVLDISSMRGIRASSRPTSAPPASSFNLSGGEWLLKDLGGTGALDNIQATLAFPEAGKVVGNGSCNRFFGPAEIHGDAIKLGPLASSRKACPEAVMSQETKFLEALQAAQRFEWKDPYLLIHCKGLEKALRFTRMAPRRETTRSPS